MHQPVFCFAGLHDRAETADGPIESFTIPARAAGRDMVSFHDRQPVILRWDHWAAWLDLAHPIDDLIECEPAGTLEASRVIAAGTAA